jgi:hypothetical protein
MVDTLGATSTTEGVLSGIDLVWSKNSSGPLPHARTSLRAQVHDKSGSVNPWLGPDRKHPFVYVRLPDMTRCPYLYAYAASRS